MPKIQGLGIYIIKEYIYEVYIDLINQWQIMQKIISNERIKEK